VTTPIGGATEPGMKIDLTAIPEGWKLACLRQAMPNRLNPFEEGWFAKIVRPGWTGTEWTSDKEAECWARTPEAAIDGAVARARCEA
jgi:hypothetical protein